MHGKNIKRKIYKKEEYLMLNREDNSLNFIEGSNRRIQCDAKFLN